MFSISKNCVCGDIGSLWNKRNMNWVLLILEFVGNGDIGSLWNKRNMNWVLLILEFVGNGGIFAHFFFLVFFFGGIFC